MVNAEAAMRVHGEEEREGFEGEGMARELGDEGVEGEGVGVGDGVEEEGEGGEDEVVGVGVGEEELGGEEGVREEEVEAEEAAVEVAEVARGGGGLEEVEVVGDCVGVWG